MIAEEMKKCYWLLKDRLLAGPYPYNPGKDQPLFFLEHLLQIGIDSFIDLTEEDELTHYARFLRANKGNKANYQRFAIEDYSVPSIELMRKIQTYIFAELNAGRKIYLHCFGGIGRTGTVAGCILVEMGLNGDEALKELQQRFTLSADARWVKTPETVEQIDFVRDWVRLQSS